jgi:hypothetical protein
MMIPTIVRENRARSAQMAEQLAEYRARGGRVEELPQGATSTVDMALTSDAKNRKAIKWVLSAKKGGAK